MPLYAVFTPRENADENIQITTQASISWTAVEDAATYTLIIYSDESRTQEITRFQLDANGNVVRSTNRELSCTITDLDVATAYYYSLTSYNTNNQALTVSAGNFITTATSGIDNISQERQINIYPNPSKDKIFIQSEQPIDKVEILDISGRTVGALRATPLQSGNVQTINVSYLPKGIYFVKIFVGNQPITKKIIKE